MLVKQDDRTLLEARAKAEPAADVMSRDYYTQRPQILLAGDPTDRPAQREAPVEGTLDGTDVAKLAEGAIGHRTGCNLSAKRCCLGCRCQRTCETAKGNRLYVIPGGWSPGSSWRRAAPA